MSANLAALILFAALIAIILIHYFSYVDCAATGGIYLKPENQFFYQCVGDDLRLSWR